jgi:pimeloyl-ACP methyl ester carboxylesterase
MNSQRNITTLDLSALNQGGEQAQPVERNTLPRPDVSAFSILLPTGIDLHYVRKLPQSSVPLEADRIGEAIVLIHGYSDSWRTYEEMLDLLPFEGYNVPVFALDMRGHGESSASSTDDYSQKAFADDIAAFSDALKIQKLVLVGHSMGGLIAHKFAVEYPEKVKALVLIATWASMSGHRVIDELRSLVETIASDAPAPVEDVVDFQASMFYNRAEPAVLYRYVSESLRLTGTVWKAALDGMAEEDHRERLSEIVAPTLILSGEQDSYAGRKDQEELIALLPHAQVVSYPRASHVLNVEQADDIIAAIRVLLAEVSSNGSSSMER